MKIGVVNEKCSVKFNSEQTCRQRCFQQLLTRIALDFAMCIMRSGKTPLTCLNFSCSCLFRLAEFFLQHLCSQGFEQSMFYHIQKTEICKFLLKLLNFENLTFFHHKTTNADQTIKHSMSKWNFVCVSIIPALVVHASTPCDYDLWQFININYNEPSEPTTTTKQASSGNKLNKLLDSRISS